VRQRRHVPCALVNSWESTAPPSFLAPGNRSYDSFLLVAISWQTGAFRRAASLGIIALSASFESTQDRGGGDHSYRLGDEVDRNITTPYRDLLSLYFKESLAELLDQMSTILKMPVALCPVDVDIHKVSPANSESFDLELCEKLQCGICVSNHSGTYCDLVNQEINSTVLDLPPEELKNLRYREISCPRGVSRIAIPIGIDDEVIALLLVGKYLRVNSERKQESEEAALRVLEKQRLIQIFESAQSAETELAKAETIESILSLPMLYAEDVEAVAREAHRYVPVVREVIVRFHPDAGTQIGRSFVDAFSTLARIENLASDILLSQEELWIRANSMLKLIVEKTHLVTGVIYYASLSDYRILEPAGYFSDVHFEPSPVEISSDEEIAWFDASESGVRFPVHNSPAEWQNACLARLYGQNAAVVFGQTQYKNRFSIIGFGHDPMDQIDDLELSFVRIAATRILSFVKTVLTNQDLERINLETGHKIRRTYGDIVGGIRRLQKYGFSQSETDDPLAKQMIKLGNNELEFGLAQLELITGNYNVLNRIVWKSHGANEPLQRNDIVDVQLLLYEFKKIYEPTLESSNKRFVFDFKTSCKIATNRDAIRVIFWNLIDNAVKFSYNNTKIRIELYRTEKHYIVKIVNTGVGIDNREANVLFLPYYKSKYRDRMKEIPGQGLGLAACKRCMDALFENGKIEIYSIDTSQGSRHLTEKRFDGDRQRTVLQVSIPLNAHLGA